MHHPTSLQQDEAVLILRLGQFLFGSQRKPPGGFLVILDHAIALGVAHPHVQLRFGVALFSARMRQGGIGGETGRGPRRVKRKPRGEADQRADGNQQEQWFQGVENPEAVPAIAAAQGV
jgi:hypothetical protein